MMKIIIAGTSLIFTFHQLFRAACFAESRISETKKVWKFKEKNHFFRGGNIQEIEEVIIQDNNNEKSQLRKKIDALYFQYRNESIDKLLQILATKIPAIRSSPEIILRINSVSNYDANLASYVLFLIAKRFIELDKNDNREKNNEKKFLKDRRLEQLVECIICSSINPNVADTEEKDEDFLSNDLLIEEAKLSTYEPKGIDNIKDFCAAMYGLVVLGFLSNSVSVLDVAGATIMKRLKIHFRDLIIDRWKLYEESKSYPLIEDLSVAMLTFVLIEECYGHDFSDILDLLYFILNQPIDGITTEKLINELVLSEDHYIREKTLAHNNESLEPKNLTLLDHSLNKTTSNSDLMILLHATVLKDKSSRCNQCKNFETWKQNLSIQVENAVEQHSPLKIQRDILKKDENETQELSSQGKFSLSNDMETEDNTVVVVDAESLLSSNGINAERELLNATLQEINADSVVLRNESVHQKNSNNGPSYMKVIDQTIFFSSTDSTNSTSQENQNLDQLLGSNFTSSEITSLTDICTVALAINSLGKSTEWIERSYDKLLSIVLDISEENVKKDDLTLTDLTFLLSSIMNNDYDIISLRDEQYWVEFLELLSLLGEKDLFSNSAASTSCAFLGLTTSLYQKVFEFSCSSTDIKERAHRLLQPFTEDVINELVKKDAGNKLSLHDLVDLLWTYSIFSSSSNTYMSELSMSSLTFIGRVYSRVEVILFQNHLSESSFNYEALNHTHDSVNNTSGKIEVGKNDFLNAAVLRQTSKRTQPELDLYALSKIIQIYSIGGEKDSVVDDDFFDILLIKATTLLSKSSPSLPNNNQTLYVMNAFLRACATHLQRQNYFRNITKKNLLNFVEFVHKWLQDFKVKESASQSTHNDLFNLNEYTNLLSFMQQILNLVEMEPGLDSNSPQFISTPKTFIAKLRSFNNQKLKGAKVSTLENLIQTYIIYTKHSQLGSPNDDSLAFVLPHIICVVAEIQSRERLLTNTEHFNIFHTLVQLRSNFLSLLLFYSPNDDAIESKSNRQNKESLSLMTMISLFLTQCNDLISCMIMTIVTDKKRPIDRWSIKDIKFALRNLLLVNIDSTSTIANDIISHFVASINKRFEISYPSSDIESLGGSKHSAPHINFLNKNSILGLIRKVSKSSIDASNVLTTLTADSDNLDEAPILRKTILEELMYHLTSCASTACELETYLKRMEKILGVFSVSFYELAKDKSNIDKILYSQEQDAWYELGKCTELIAFYEQIHLHSNPYFTHILSRKDRSSYWDYCNVLFNNIINNR